MHIVNVKDFTIGKGKSLALISGPCAIESRDIAFYTADFLKSLCQRLGVPLIFKSSYDKANRSSVSSSRGPGLDQGLFILSEVKKNFDLPIVTDVHSPEEARAAGEVCDILQIPAFLCRQTDLLVAAAETGRVVKIKKGQFMAPWDMEKAVEKVHASGSGGVILTERGTCFGYNNLVSDMRSIPIMQQFAPVCYDATHSVQLPGARGDSSGGERAFLPTLAAAAVAAGCDALFMEAHPNPDEAISDRETQVPLSEMEAILTKLLAIRAAMEAAHV